MSCPLEALSSAVAAVAELPVPAGAGADVALRGQVRAVAGAIARLQRDLAARMAALERAEPLASDVRGDAVRAGLDTRSAQQLRRTGRFADQHEAVAQAWRSGSIRLEQVDILRAGASKVSGHRRREFVSTVLHLLPGLDEKATGRWSSPPSIVLSRAIRITRRSRTMRLDGLRGPESPVGGSRSRATCRRQRVAPSPAQ